MGVAVRPRRRVAARARLAAADARLSAALYLTFPPAPRYFCVRFHDLPLCSSSHTTASPEWRPHSSSVGPQNFMVSQERMTTS